MWIYISGREAPAEREARERGRSGKTAAPWSYIIICQLWLRTCVAWKSRGGDFRWCEVRIYISGREAPAEREARERAKWNERSPLVYNYLSALAAYLRCLEKSRSRF